MANVLPDLQSLLTREVLAPVVYLNSAAEARGLHRGSDPAGTSSYDRDHCIAGDGEALIVLIMEPLVESLKELYRLPMGRVFLPSLVRPRAAHAVSVERRSINRIGGGDDLIGGMRVLERDEVRRKTLNFL